MKELPPVKSLVYGVFDAATRVFGRRKAAAEDTVALPDSPRILLVEFYGLGDLVILGGALDSLRKRWPTAKITLLAPPVAAAIFGHDRRIDALEIFSFPWHPHLHKNAPHRWDWKALRALTGRLRKEGWDLMLGRSDLAMNLLAKAIGPRVAIGLDHPGGKHFLTHLVEEKQNTFDYEGRIWQAYLRKLGCAPASYVPRIVSDPDDAESRAWLEKVAAWRQPARPLIGIHPGASLLSRCWPLERFQQVAAALRERADVLWFVDQNNLLPAAEDDRILPARCGLKPFVNLVARCDGYFGNDSGGMHIAAALGRPTFAIFGPQRPERFAPPNLAGLFFVPDFPCRPCSDKCIHPGVPPCLDRIPVAKVLESLNRFLDERIRSSAEHSAGRGAPG